MREEALPVPEKKNLVPFPRSAKKRKQLLRQAESLKLRRLTRLRSLVGWLLILSILLFAAANFTLFSLSSLRQGFQIVTNALGPESGRDGRHQLSGRCGQRRQACRLFACGPG